LPGAAKQTALKDQNTGLDSLCISAKFQTGLNMRLGQLWHLVAAAGFAVAAPTRPVPRGKNELSALPCCQAKLI